MFYLRLMDLLIVWHLRHFSMQMMSTVPCQPISGRMAFGVAIGGPNPPQWPNDYLPCSWELRNLYVLLKFALVTSTFEV